MKSIVKLITWQVLLVMLLCANSFAQGMSIKVGEKAPDFKLKDFSSGKEISLSDYNGKKIVLLEFWATWCVICRREIPYLVNYYNTNKANDDFEILAVLLPSENDKVKVEELITKYKIPYPMLVDTDNKVATEKYELSGLIPVMAIIDKEGIVQFEAVGDLGETDLQIIIDDLRDKEKEKGGK